ncbi:copper-translocating P-type ATPase [Vibrio cholerae]
MYRFDIPLQGLSCMGCARKVERALIEHHALTVLDVSKKHIEVESHAPYGELAKTVASLGYQSGTSCAFSLSGLNCGRCVAKLRTALESHPSIGDVDISTTKLTVTGLLTADELIALVQETGYDAVPIEDSPLILEDTVGEDLIGEEPIKESGDEPQSASQRNSNEHRLYFAISGMTCASCVSSVEKALLSVEGVNRVSVNLAEQTASVFSQRESAQILADLVEASQSAGYQATHIADPNTQQDEQAANLAKQQAQHKRSALAGLIVGAPLMLWGVLGGSMMIQNRSDQWAWGIVGLICFALLASAGRGFFVNAIAALRHKRATMDTLVALGTGAAWLFSMLVVVVPQWFPVASRHVYFEASAMIIGLISLGHYIEAKAKAKTTQSLKALINLQSNDALLVDEQGERTIPIDQITQGMMLRAMPGAQFAVDGVVTDGESYVDESMLTGEPIPVFKRSGDTVHAGTLNQDGSLLYKATSVGSHTMLAKIIKLVRDAQSSKPQIAKLADQISSVFVPVVVAIALIAAAVWFFVGPEPKASYMLVTATTVLIIACPCALGLATPLSVTVGIGKAAELGILIKDADVLQSASRIDTVVFDKTGTLTQGKPEVQFHARYHIDDETLLALSAGIERHSEHPLAKAIVHYAKASHITPLPITHFTNLRGQGVTGHYQKQSLSAVSLNYAKAQGWDLSLADADIKRAADQAYTPIIIALDEQVVGVMAIADGIKPDSARTITTLKNMGITPVLLTGDNAHVANAIAKQLGIDEVIAEVLPDQKAQHIESQKARGQRVAMVGDGVNDAPALALADIGIAMGSGSDVAIESAQMTLLNASPMAVVQAIELSKATLKNMKQNLFGAFIYNSLGIPVAAGVLYPLFGFLLSPVIAGAAMALSSITVVSNANRLRLFKTSTQLGDRS